MTTTGTSDKAATTAFDHRAAVPRRLHAWESAIGRLRATRATRTARAQLERELREFRTPAERLELDIILARYEVAEAPEVHRIVARHRAA